MECILFGALEVVDHPDFEKSDQHEGENDNEHGE